MELKDELASYWSRIGGGLIDFLIAAIATVIFMFIWGLLEGASATYATQRVALTSFETWQHRGFITGVLIDFALTTVFMSDAKQSTLGQRAVGIKTTKQNGGKIGFGAAAVRYFFSLISSLLFKLGFIIAIFTENRKTFHDFIAGTVVVKKSYVPKDETELPKMFSANLQESSMEKSFKKRDEKAYTYQTTNTAAKQSNASMEDAYAAVAPSSEKIHGKVELVSRVSKVMPESNEENFWEQSLNEYDGPERKKGIWAKLYADFEGDEQKIKTAYLKTRALQLKEEKIKDYLAQEKEKEAMQQEKFRNVTFEECYREKNYAIYDAIGFECYVFHNGLAAIKRFSQLKVYESKAALINSLTAYRERGFFLNDGLVKEVDVVTI